MLCSDIFANIKILINFSKTIAILVISSVNEKSISRVFRFLPVVEMTNLGSFREI